MNLRLAALPPETVLACRLWIHGPEGCYRRMAFRPTGEGLFGPVVAELMGTPAS
jgi:hypothetical protein